MCSRGAQIVLEILLQAIRTLFTQLWRKYCVAGKMSMKELVKLVILMQTRFLSGTWHFQGIQSIFPI